MMPRFETAVFDIDGTLLDTAEGVLSSVKYTIDRFGFKPLTEEELLTFIGPPVQNSFAFHYGLEGEILQELAAVFRNHYSSTDLYKAKPYEGIFNAVERLTSGGCRFAVATYKREDYTVDLMHHFGFDQYSDIFCGSDHENRLKKKDIIEKAIRLSGCADPAKAVMIGDSDNDAVGAAGAGTAFIGVTYGFGFHSEKDVRPFDNIGTAAKAEQIPDFVL